MSELNKILKISRQIHIVDKLGGRDSFFGMLEIFHITLEEEHSNNSNIGMYRYKGMGQYGNIVSIPRIYDSIEKCVKRYNFTKSEFDKILDWYKDSQTPDCQILYLVIGWCLKDKKYFESNF